MAVPDTRLVQPDRCKEIQGSIEQQRALPLSLATSLSALILPFLSASVRMADVSGMLRFLINQDLFLVGKGRDMPFPGAYGSIDAYLVPNGQLAKLLNHHLLLCYPFPTPDQPNTVVICLVAGCIAVYNQRQGATQACRGGGAAPTLCQQPGCCLLQPTPQLATTPRGIEGAGSMGSYCSSNSSRQQQQQAHHQQQQQHGHCKVQDTSSWYKQHSDVLYCFWCKQQ